MNLRLILLPFICLVLLASIGPLDTFAIPSNPSSRIPITGVIHQVNRLGRAPYTYIDIQVGEEFTGQLPEAIDTILVTGPNGKLFLGLEDFSFLADKRLFWASLPGSPASGAYEFSVTSGALAGTARVVRTDPYAMPVAFVKADYPAPEASVTCPSPIFSWSAVGGEPSHYYQLQIQDAQKLEVFRSAFMRDQFTFRPPPRLFERGKGYRWRVRVTDADQWLEIKNRSHSPWQGFTLSSSFAPCDYEIQVPRARRDGWNVSSLEDAGFTQEPINVLVRDILTFKFKNIDSVVIAKGNRLVLDEYFNGYTADDLHALYSVSKSVTSLLVGIARDQGGIPGLESKVYTFFPQYLDTRWVAQGYPINLRHLLTMSAGVEWDAFTHPPGDPRNDTTALLARSSDPLRYVLDKPLTGRPGGRWNYNDGLTLLLGAIVGNRSGMPADRFANQYLFGPLGISYYYWNHLQDGTVDTPGGLKMRPRDMAKLGLLVLNKGRFGSRQLVSAAWIGESTAGHTSNSTYDYGYQWYSGRSLINGIEVEATWAWGLGGQVIFICPKLELVTVVTSKPDIEGKDYFDEPGLYQPLEMLERYILPALLPTFRNKIPVELSDDELEEYTGEYSLGPYGKKVVITCRGKQLYAEDPTGETLPLHLETKDLLLGEAPEMGPFQVKLSRTGNGHIKDATLYYSPFVSRHLVRTDR